MKEVIPTQFTKSTSWFIGTGIDFALKTKIDKIGTPLKNWNSKIYRGVLTGLNEAFIIDTTTRNMLISEDPESKKIIKPILRGRDISRYTYNFADLYLLQTGYDLDIPNLYPVVYSYLKDI